MGVEVTVVVGVEVTVVVRDDVGVVDFEEDAVVVPVVLVVSEVVCVLVTVLVPVEVIEVVVVGLDVCDVVSVVVVGLVVTVVVGDVNSQSTNPPPAHASTMLFIIVTVALQSSEAYRWVPIAQPTLAVSVTAGPINSFTAPASTAAVAPHSAVLTTRVGTPSSSELQRTMETFGLHTSSSSFRTATCASQLCPSIT